LSKIDENRKIKHWLESLVKDGSPERLQAFFVEELNFHPYNKDILSILTERLKNGVLSLRIIARQDEFYVILCEIDHLLKGIEKPIAEFIETRYPHCLIVFTTPEHSEWHFTNIKYVKLEKKEFDRRPGPFRRIVVGSTERLRTASERLSMIVVDDSDSALSVREKCNRAFDVQEVTREFYQDFVYYYKNFRDTLKKRNRITEQKADTLTQNIFNRLFFLYYIQKKRLLGGNPRYLYDNFRQIHASKKGNYYKDFLLPLFKKLSDLNFKDSRFDDVPFLNGGLFEFDPLEEKITIPDTAFEAVFEDLLERYNFTVREDTEFEQEVAIDPEMLGTIFERLVLALEKKEFKDIPDARRGTGSYYTPKFIVAFMVKQSLLNYLAEEFAGKRKVLKDLVFNLKTDGFSPDELRAIKERLLDIKIADPGVGSGAFPVGVLLKMVEIIETIDRLLEPDLVERDDYRYALKRSIIENNIYGVDIQRRAVNLANLRLWLSLIVDLNVKSVKDVPPLPNLDYHIIEGDSLVSKIGEVDFDLERLVKLDTKGTELVDRFIRLKKEHERIPSREKKEKQKQKIEKAKKDLCLWFLKKLKKEKEKELANLYDAKFDFMKDETLFTKQEEKKKERLKEELKTIDKNIKNADTLIKGFNWGLDFFEVLEMRGGFDIVIGNPPYGVKVSDTVKNDFGLGNKDSYGAFTALGLKILRPGGTLCFIMSDTWQTIRTHKPLRDKLLSETDCQYLISCPPDTFGATVNVGVYTFKKRLVPEMGGDNWILAGDFSPLSIEKGELEAAFEMLIEQNEFDETKDGYTICSDRDMAIFAYRQKLITRFSNHSFFIASPKLFGLMRDVGNIKNELRREDEPPVYSVEFNGKELEMVKLGDVAEVKQGLATGDNYYYLRQSKEKIEGAARNYSVVDLDLVLREDELERIANDEELRKEIIEKGISKRPGNRRYFGGRYFVPYDKGVHLT